MKAAQMNAEAIREPAPFEVRIHRGAHEIGGKLRRAAPRPGHVDPGHRQTPDRGLGHRYSAARGHRLADKLAATFATYGRSNRPSTRVKDLIDLVVLAHCAHISAGEAITAVRAQASRRSIVLPGRFDLPDLDHWSRHYPIEARKVRGLAEQTLGEAVTIVNYFVDPILAGAAVGLWDPFTLRWRQLP